MSRKIKAAVSAVAVAALLAPAAQAGAPASKQPLKHRIATTAWGNKCGHNTKNCS